MAHALLLATRSCEVWRGAMPETHVFQRSRVSLALGRRHTRVDQWQLDISAAGARHTG